MAAKKEHNGSRDETPNLQGGPKKSGRNRSHRNVTAEQLVMSRKGPLTFDELKAMLLSLGKPRDVLEQLALDDIAVKTWQFRQALKNERSDLEREDTDQEPSFDDNTRPRRYWGEGRRELQQAMKLLHELKGVRVELRSDLEEPVAALIGEDFLRLLKEWQPTNILYVLVAEQMIEKAKTYDLKCDAAPDPAMLEAAQEKQALFEAQLRQQMVEKLIDQEIMHVTLLLQIHQQPWRVDRRDASVSPAPRSSTVRRELRQAVNWFCELQRRQLG
jgi:hypothetical protein